MTTRISSAATWLLIPVLLAATASGQQAETTTLSEGQLEQLAAPIALYPDSLISQVLIAATYPLEVVEAARWQKSNPKLKGDALGKAVEKQTWDASVKSLVNFPDVLAMLSDRLSWTQQLGNAVLGQQKELMNAVQRLRAKAKAKGNLDSNTQQTVMVEDQVIKIEPANPTVVYVPAYNPAVVYGPWPYPYYPAPRPYYPPGYVATAAVVGFAAGVAYGSCWGYAWGGCRWGHGDIDIDVNRNTNFNRNISRERNVTRTRIDQRGNRNGRGSWKHNPTHRRGVGYADRSTAQRFNRAGSTQRQQAREQFRGRSSATRSGTNRANNVRSAASGSRSRRSSSSHGAFGGVSSRGRTMSHSSRGRSSRSTSHSRTSRGGGRMRGGGRRGGGRGRR